MFIAFLVILLSSGNFSRTKKHLHLARVQVLFFYYINSVIKNNVNVNKIGMLIKVDLLLHKFVLHVLH